MILNKFNNSLKRNGIVKTIRISLIYLFTLYKRKKLLKKFTKNLENHTVEDKFIWIYKNNWWGSNESLSGNGSTLEYTNNLRKELPKLIIDFNICSVLDAPCGDFNWMKVLLPTLNINYIGADIVQDLVDSNNAKYKNKSIKFLKLNIITDSFPPADLLICRDCLFHLSNEDIQSVLMNFINSKISYLLTTTHKNTNNFKNINIQTGDYRHIDLFSYPFNFPVNTLVRIDDYVLPLETEICLFSREQILSIEV